VWGQVPELLEQGMNWELKWVLDQQERQQLLGQVYRQ
tara:strand:- start:88 stop:198 length:111 start_codon:yes stop_codon:yes gene_type:complete